MIKRLLLMLVIAVAIVIGIGLLLPATAVIERSVLINTTPEAIYPHIADMQRWAPWTPWGKEADPTMTLSYSAPSDGSGAWQRWSGEHAGKGELAVTDCVPCKVVRYKLRVNDGQLVTEGELVLEPAEGATHVTWRDRSEPGDNLFRRYVAYFLLDGQVGDGLEYGLNKLKHVVETGSAPTP